MSHQTFDWRLDGVGKYISGVEGGVGDGVCVRLHVGLFYIRTPLSMILRINGRCRTKELTFSPRTGVVRRGIDVPSSETVLVTPGGPPESDRDLYFSIGTIVGVCGGGRLELGKEGHRFENGILCEGGVVSLYLGQVFTGGGCYCI